MLTDEYIQQKASVGESTYQAVMQFFAQTISDASNAIEIIKSSIFDVLDQFDEQDAAFLFLSLLTQLQNIGGVKNSISVFTTNYDTRSFMDQLTGKLAGKG